MHIQKWILVLWTRNVDIIQKWASWYVLRIRKSPFTHIHTEYLNPEWVAEKEIMAVIILDVNDFNFKIHQLLPGDLVSYKSIDTVCDTNETVGSPIILLRNLNHY
ncbi:Uncharacterized protein FWK35_00030415 [Aphis craccivora]|uniref:Uncharacterized protein n=1 Tax=Aphis craccivora TaxID=307492 RepID=A0A6G0VS71_APHCR|nr:Uncharacterized protein FWK35_00030415 [Aphis craccivora]